MESIEGRGTSLGGHEYTMKKMRPHGTLIKSLATAKISVAHSHIIFPVMDIEIVQRIKFCRSII